MWSVRGSEIFAAASFILLMSIPTVLCNLSVPEDSFAAMDEPSGWSTLIFSSAKMNLYSTEQPEFVESSEMENTFGNKTYGNPEFFCGSVLLSKLQNLSTYPAMCTKDKVIGNVKGQNQTGDDVIINFAEENNTSFDGMIAGQEDFSSSNESSVHANVSNCLLHDNCDDGLGKDAGEKEHFDDEYTYSRRGVLVIIPVVFAYFVLLLSLMYGPFLLVKCWRRAKLARKGQIMIRDFD